MCVNVSMCIDVYSHINTLKHICVLMCVDECEFVLLYECVNVC